MQQAYAVEKNLVGSWDQIGYKSPAGKSGESTTNFKYDGAATTWTATSLAKMNDCVKGATWVITSSLPTASDAIDGDVVFTASGTAVVANKATCMEQLTPSFVNIVTSVSSK